MSPNFDCKVLLVEDDASDASLLRQSLRSVNSAACDIHWVKSLAEAQTYLSEQIPDVILLDLTLPDSSGLDTVHAGRLAAGALPLIVLTGHNDPDFALQTLEAGAQDYLVKGDFEPDALIRSIRYAMSRAKLEQRLYEAEERWRFALEGAGEGVWDWNLATNEVMFSKRLKQMLGYAEEDLQDHLDEWTKRLHPEDAPAVLNEVKRYLAGESSTYLSEHRLQCKNGQWKWILDRGMVVSRNAAGEPLRMIGTHADIDRTKRAEEMMQLSRTVFNTVDEAIMVCDANNLIITVNPSFERVTGYTQKEVQGKSPHILSSGKHDIDFYRELWQKLTSTGSWTGEIWNRRKQGNLFVEWVSIKQVHDKHGKLTHYVAAFSDITARKASEETIRHQAQYDTLTDLPNRLLLLDRLQQALAQAKRDKTKLALMYLDLDKFKPINDSLGHAIGDLLLREVAVRMHHCMREMDTVARIGGDEFVVLLPVIESEHDALMVAEKIRCALNQVFTIDGHDLHISSSTGVAIYPDHGSNETELTGNADIAMYQAKEAGRNRVKLFEPENAEK